MKDKDLTSIDIDSEEEYDEEYDESGKSGKTGRKNSKQNAFLKELLIDSVYLLVVLVLTLLFVRYVAQRTVVDGFSMQPQLQNQDNLIVDKITYRFKDPQRFDIVVFPFEYRKNEYYIKRIIGLPGETIQIDEQGNIYINGQLLEEHYGAEVIEEPGRAALPITLGDDEYFVMGDNRNHSSDSRTTAVGNVSRDEIIGRAWLRVYPFDQFGLIKYGED